MLGKPRSSLTSLKNSAPLNTFVPVKQTHKDKRLPMVLFLPADSVCLP